jgi:hypothetical protein
MFDPAKILGGGLKTIGKGFLGKIAEATVGEGAEEGITAALNPFIKMLTYKGETENPFGSWENFKSYLRDIGQSVYQGAIIGGLTLGVSAPGNVDLQKSFSNDVHKAVEKIQGINQAKKNEIANAILEGANIETINLPEMDVATQKQLKSLGIQKNKLSNVAQNVPNQQTNTTLPPQAEVAQKANMNQTEQNRISDQYFANNKVVYNNDGTVNRIKTGENIFENNEGKSIEKTIKDYLKQHINEYANIIESGQKVYLGEDLPGEYVYSKNARNLSTRELLAKGRAATGIKEIIENANNRSWSKNLKEKHEEDAKYGFYTYDTTFSFDQNGKEKV